MLIKYIFLLLYFLATILNAHEIKYYLYAHEYCYFTYNISKKFVVEWDKNRFNFVDKNFVKNPLYKIDDHNITQYYKLYFDNKKLQRVELVKITSVIVQKGIIKHIQNFKELKILKLFEYDKKERVVFESDLASGSFIKYTYKSNNIRKSFYQNNKLQKIEIESYHDNLINVPSIRLTEGILNKHDKVKKYSIEYGSNKKIIHFIVYTYSQNVHSCIYNAEGEILNSISIPSKWIIKTDKNGRKYPTIKKELCERLDFKPKDKYRLENIITTTDL